MKKASKIEVRNRISTIQLWIIDGLQNSLIKKQAQEKWKVSERQVKRYIKYAYNNWRSDEEISIKDKRAAKIAELKQLRRTLQQQYKGTPSGISAIMNVEKEIIKLEGLVPLKQGKENDNTDKSNTVNQVVIFKLPDNGR